MCVLKLEVRDMSKSNYEKYAEAKQQELLHKERNLQQAISCLRVHILYAFVKNNINIRENVIYG